MRPERQTSVTAVTGRPCSTGVDGSPAHCRKQGRQMCRITGRCSPPAPTTIEACG